jgi:hypothetical protein
MSDVNAVPDTPVMPVEIVQIGFDANGNGVFVVGLPQAEAGLYPLPDSMTSHVAGRYSLVNGVVTDNYPGQTDEQVVIALAAVLADSNAAAEAAAAAAAAAFAATQPVQITKLQMMDLFTLAELEAIYNAGTTTVLVRIWLDKLQASTFVTLNDPQTIAGINALVTATLLTQDRATAILANQAPAVTTTS